MKNEIVSIIVPVYNVQSFIGKCAESLFSQSYYNCEFVFVDDCSTDESISILLNLIPKFGVQDKTIIVKHESNKGLAQARNSGIEVAHGKYVMHVDSDDYIESATIEEAYNTAILNDADIVLLGLKHIFSNKSVIEHICIPNNKEDYLRKLLIRECTCSIWGCLYKKALYIDNDIKAIPGLNMGEDYSTKPRLIYYANKIVAHDKPLYNYIHLNAISYTSKFTEKNVDDLSKAIDVLKIFFEEKGEFDKYSKCFRIAKTLAKVNSINSWALSAANALLVNYISIKFKETCYSHIAKQYWPVLFLYDIGCYKFLRYYVRIGFKIKYLLK